MYHIGLSMHTHKHTHLMLLVFSSSRSSDACSVRKTKIDAHTVSGNDAISSDTFI